MWPFGEETQRTTCWTNNRQSTAALPRNTTLTHTHACTHIHAHAVLCVYGCVWLHVSREQGPVLEFLSQPIKAEQTPSTHRHLQPMTLNKRLSQPMECWEAGGVSWSVHVELHRFQNTEKQQILGIWRKRRRQRKVQICIIRSLSVLITLEDVCVLKL